MTIIKKIKLRNFKRFQDLSVEFDEKLNILIGDNESGKSSILSAIDFVLCGSRTKVETVGLESLFNSEVIHNYLRSDRKFENLPELFIELYFDEQNNINLNGKFNSEDISADGLRLDCVPDDTLSIDIKDILAQKDSTFPFEYYMINFRTFSGEGYSGHRKFIKHVLIDNSQINSEYATKEYVKTIYGGYLKGSEKNKHQNEYRKYKEEFKNKVLVEVNNRIPDYSFAIKTGSKADLETDLTISENNINIENKGKGKQCFIKTEFALKKKFKDKDLDLILLEEPENHLSHINMKKLIRKISESEGRQLIIATHNDLIITRLDLRKAILLNSNSLEVVLLKDLSEETAKFFIKAPDKNVLEFILSKKVILVEGDAEYILMEAFYQHIFGEKLEDSNIHVISVDGTSFKRYLEIANLLHIKTAVVRDNDGNYKINCVDNYSKYVGDFSQIFSDRDNELCTFEICLYQVNSKLCDGLFSDGRKTLTVQEYMLKNKTDAAFEILDKKGNEVIPPRYFHEAIEWIKR